MDDFSFEELRLLVLTSIANGNAAGKMSPFLHATTSIKTCTWIHRERQELYSNWLVRWPKAAVDYSNVIDFTNAGVRARFFAEQDTDSSLVRKYIDCAYAYTAKDDELLYLVRPPLDKVDWWDEEGKEWVSALHAAKSHEWMRKLCADKCNINVFSTDGDRLQAASKTSEASYWGKA